MVALPQGGGGGGAGDMTKAAYDTDADNIVDNAEQVDGYEGIAFAIRSDIATVTGLWTFDRDPNAPFAVSASSAVVTNLDSDLVDGLHASAFAVVAHTHTYLEIKASLYGGPATAAGTTRYGSPGWSGLTATESQAKLPMPVAGTMKNLYARVDVNSLSGTLIITIRKDTGAGPADTTLTVTITAGSTALFSDTANSFTFNAGDYLSYSVVAAAGTGSYQFISHAVAVEKTT